MGRPTCGVNSADTDCDDACGLGRKSHCDEDGVPAALCILCVPLTSTVD